MKENLADKAKEFLSEAMKNQKWTYCAVIDALVFNFKYSTNTAKYVFQKLRSTNFLKREKGGIRLNQIVTE